MEMLWCGCERSGMLILYIYHDSRRIHLCLIFSSLRSYVNIFIYIDTFIILYEILGIYADSS